MNAKILQHLQPQLYMQEFLRKDVRIDGRKCLEWRDTSIEYGMLSACAGSALCKIGATSALTGIQLMVTTPKVGEPSKGLVELKVHLTPVCSSKFRIGSQSDESYVIAENIVQALLTSQMLDMTSLCIEKGKQVWKLFIDITCLSYSGNVYDAAMLSAMAAITDVRLPAPQTVDSTVEYNLRTLQSNGQWDSCPRLQLTSERIPLSTSYCLINHKVIADPLEEELECSSLSVCITTLGNGKIYSISHTSSPSRNTLPDTNEVDPYQFDSFLKECLQDNKSRTAYIREHVLDLSSSS